MNKNHIRLILYDYCMISTMDFYIFGSVGDEIHCNVMIRKRRGKILSKKFFEMQVVVVMSSKVLNVCCFMKLVLQIIFHWSRLVKGEKSLLIVYFTEHDSDISSPRHTDIASLNCICYTVKQHSM